MQASFGQSASALQEFEHHTQSLETEWGAFIHQSLEALHSTGQETAQSVESALIAAINQHSQEFAGAVEHTVTGPLTEGAQQVMDAARDELENQVKHLISEIGQHFNDTLSQISQELTQSTSSSSEVRELLKPVFDDRQRLTDPITQVVKSVQQVAATVGIHV